jgi:hypothetical protein
MSTASKYFRLTLIARNSSFLLPFDRAALQPHLKQHHHSNETATANFESISAPCITLSICLTTQKFYLAPTNLNLNLTIISCENTMYFLEIGAEWSIHRFVGPDGQVPQFFSLLML